MKLLTKNTDYAVRALVHLASNPGRFIPSSEIAASECIPESFLKRLLQKMIREGILEAREGAAGGVQLKKKADRITVIDLIRIFQGQFQLSECMFRRKICPNRATCVLRSRIRGIEKKIETEFAGITIATLINDLEG